jgi:hypothetical protein
MQSRTFQLARPCSNALNANTSPTTRAIFRGGPYTVSRIDSFPGPTPLSHLRRRCHGRSCRGQTARSRSCRCGRSEASLAHNMRLRGSGALGGPQDRCRQCGSPAVSADPLRLLPDPRPSRIADVVDQEVGELFSRRPLEQHRFGYPLEQPFPPSSSTPSLAGPSRSTPRPARHPAAPQAAGEVDPPRQCPRKRQAMSPSHISLSRTASSS